MENPCIGCNCRFYGCKESCDSIRMYKGVMIMRGKIITEEQYDKLPDQAQSYYWYCVACEQYILRGEEHRCGGKVNV